MAEPIKISELPVVGDVSTSAMFPMSQTGADGLATYKATAADLSKALMSDFVYSDLETDSKNAIGAINESARKINALQSIVDGIKVEFQKNHAEGDFTFKSGVIGSVLQGLQGKSEKTKNLLKPTLATTTQNGVTCTANGDGTYTLNGTATAIATFLVVGNNVLNPLFGKQIRLVGCPSGGSTSTFRLQVWTNVDPVRYDLSEGGTFTISTNTTSSNVAIIISSGYTCNNLVFKPMITEDLSATYADYEPYFDGLKDSAVTKFKVESKNLLTQEKLSLSNANLLEFGETIKINKTDAYSQIGFDFHDLPSGTYTLSLESVSDSSGGKTPDIRAYYNNNVTLISAVASKTNTFYYDRQNGYLRVWVRTTESTSNESTTILVNKFQLERGSVVTPYSLPFNSKDYPITFNGKSAGSVRDEVDLVSKKYIRRVGSVDLGTLNYTYTGAGTNSRRFFTRDLGSLIKQQSDRAQVANIFCALYDNVSDADLTRNTLDQDLLMGSTGVFVGFRNHAYETADDFKTAMSGVILNFELATPVIEDITESEIMAVVNAGDRVAFDNMRAVDLGTLDWTMGSNNRFATHDIDKTVKFVPNTSKANATCSLYSVDTANNVYAKVTDKTISISVDGAIYIYDTSYSSAEEFKTAMQGVILYYEPNDNIKVPIGSDWNDLVFLKGV